MYFAKPGKKNTNATVEAALMAARERSIGHIVVASSSGETALLLAGFEGNVVCVTHAYGFSEDGRNEMPDEMRAKLIASGLKVYTGTHVLSGADRGLSNHFQGIYPPEIMAHALRMLGQGVKVCVEVAVMALDAGLIPHGQKIVAVGGTTGGADTALIISPAHANHILKTKIHEIICKPSAI